MVDQTSNFSPEDIEKTKGLAWLSYLGFLFLIPLLVYRDSPYTKFHVNQGIVLFIAEVILGIVITVLGFIPIIGVILSLILNLLYIVTFVFAIMGIVFSLQGQAKRLPIIGNIDLYK